MEIKKNLRPKSGPSKPIRDMFNSGLLNGNVLEVGSVSNQNLNFLMTVKPNSIISGCSFDMLMGDIKYDTVISSYIFNYLSTKQEIDQFFQTIRSKMLTGGRMIVIARSIAEVKGNTKRTGNWKYDTNLSGFVSNEGVFQRGYDNLELDNIVKSYGFDVITKEFEIQPKPYSFTVAR